MKKKRTKNYLKIGVIAATLLMASISFFLQRTTFYNRKRDLLKLAYTQSVDTYLIVEQITFAALHFAEEYQVISESFFDEDGYHKPFAEMLADEAYALYRYSDEKETFSVTLSHGDSFEGGRIVGVDDLSNDPLRQQEMGLIFKVIDHIHHSRGDFVKILQTYYMSKEGAIGGFSPDFSRGDSEEFYTKEMIYGFIGMVQEREYWKIILPEVNPERSIRWSTPYEDNQTEKMVFTIGVPIYRGDEFLGGFFLDIDASFFINILVAEKEENWILVNEEFEYIYGVEGAEELVENAALREWLVSRDSPKPTDSLNLFKMDDETQGYQKIGDNYYFSQKLNAYPGYLITYLSESHFGSIRFSRYRRFILVSFLASIIGFSLYRALNKLVVKPADEHLARLSADTEGMSIFLDAIPIPTFVTDMESWKTTYANKRMRDLLSDEEHEELLLQLSGVEEPATFMTFRDKIFRFGTVDDFEQECHIGNRSLFFSISAVKIEHNSRPSLLMELNNITDRKQRERDLAIMANKDILTGLYNRRYFLEAMEMEFASERKSEEFFSLLTFDIDHFKKINDTWGHEAGDVALKTFAATIQELLRREDLFARIGGEEFFLAIFNVKKAGVLDFAERIRLAVMAIEIPMGEDICRFTTSIGVSIDNRNYDSLKQMMEVADKSLYRVKESGRNKVGYFPEIV